MNRKLFPIPRFWSLLVGYLLTAPLSVLATDVVVADANGNELTYSYDSADGPATFKAVKTYAADEAKKGRIIIADNVTDTDGKTHEVKYISGSVGNRSNIVSIVFGQNIVATGGPEGTSSSAFEDCRKLTSVTLNAKLEILGSKTFINCYAMEHLNLGDCVNLKTIKNSAIEDCDHVRELTIPASVTSIEAYGIYSIDSLCAITFAAGSQLQSLGNNAFQYNSKLETINLETCTQLASIGNNAFGNCPTLRELTIPASVTAFGSGVLTSTNNIETITFLAPTVPEEFYKGRSKLTTINIGPGVKSIGKNSFRENYTLKQLNFATAVSDLSIGYAAFYNCDIMETLTLPAGVKELGDYAFQSIDSLKTVTIVEGSQLEKIGYRAFQYCITLQHINLEAATQLKDIAGQAFYECYELKSITFPASIETMVKDVLWYDNKIETITFLAATIPADFYASAQSLTTLNIGPGVKSIGNNAFKNINTLKNINIDPAVDGLAIGNNVFNNCDGLKSCHLPVGVVSLGEGVFASCDSLRTFTFAEGSPITAIPYNTFPGCSSLEKIKIPDAVKTVATGAFYNCYSLREIEFGTGLEEFAQDWGLFNNCPIEKMVLPGLNYPFKGTNPTSYLNSNAVLYVHPDMVETYRTTSYTSRFHIMAIGATTDFAVTTTAGGQLQAKVPEDLAQFAQKLTVTGPLNGTDIEYLHSAFPLIEVLDLKNARIVAGGDTYHEFDVAANGKATPRTNRPTIATEDNVIGYAMFYNMPTLQSLSLPKDATKMGQWAVSQNETHNLKLTHIDIPSGLTEIGANAFRYTGISEITIPAGVTRLEEYTFYHCEKLQKAVLPDGITFIGRYCFSDDTELLDVNIPANVETIGDYAFYRNDKRSTPIVFPATLKTIGGHAFRENRRLKSVTFNDGLETIGSWAFSDCNDIESITLPATVTTMYDRAFQSLDSITQFTFPASITKVPEAVLYHCDKLQTVTLAAGTTSIAANAFENCVQLATINLTEQTTLTSVGVRAFANTGFTTVTLPNSITSMGYSAFRECKNLQSINVPTGLNTVPYDFVCYCPVLTSVQMHDGIRVVGHNAFLGCPLLNDVVLNDEITTIEYDAFNGCESLELTKLPAALTSIGSSSFRNMKALSGTLTIPEGVTKIDGDAFRGSALSGIILPDGLTSLGNSVFAETPNLSYVKLPATLTRIPNYTFYMATALKRIDLPETLLEVGYGAFQYSGLTVIDLPETVSLIERYAFSNTQLQFFRVPDGHSSTSIGAYALENCKHLKKAYMGRNEPYADIVEFTCLNGCDSLELLRVYFGQPPKCNTNYMKYRFNTVLEVPEDLVEAYSQANGWKDFKEIRGFFTGDVLNDNDFALLCKLSRELDGQHWQMTTKWDLSNNHHATDKWTGISTKNIGGETFAITAIDLHEQGLTGVLPDSLFFLSHLQTVNLSGNQLTGDIGTFRVLEGSAIEDLNLSGNQLTGDAYPFATKLSSLKKLDLSYNMLTDISQAIPNDKLTNLNYSYQFIDINTHEVVGNASERYSVGINDSTRVGIPQITVGLPFEQPLPRTITYRHAQQDFGFTSNDLAHLYWDGYWYQPWALDWEFCQKDGQWNLYKGNDNVLRAPKGEVLAYTPKGSNYKTLLMRLDWQDGDVNADQTVDILDLQNVVYYALNDKKPQDAMYNFTTADTNGDRLLDVRDIVGTVDRVLGFEKPAEAREPYDNRETYDASNILSVSGNTVTLANSEVVAALQITVNGATSSFINIGSTLQGRFNVSMRDMGSDVRIVIYSPSGATLPEGDHELITNLPIGATVSDVCLSDPQARRLGAAILGTTTAVPYVATESQQTEQIYDLSGRPVGPWHTLPSGIYIITANGQQYKVKK